MRNQHYRVIDAAPVLTHPDQYLPSSQQGPQTFLVLHQYLDGTEVFFETIQKGTWEAGATRWDWVVVRPPERPSEHQTPPKPQSGDQGCLNELASQIHSLPGHYGSTAPVDAGSAIAPSLPNASAAAPVELDGQNMEPANQAIDPDDYVYEPSQAARIEPQRSTAPRSLDAIVASIQAARIKPKQSRLRRYLQSIL
ncbi:hypothetical protein B5807_04497 [Epicoccum nigrum]|jgi:hypothetical protein|uniref:Uncharacterized protein n=1 Tax=Epicoccum nigrum TaxID=105696 RepID=A0A1Y2M6C8_EPING|nr:hypothetical protein B5807_04497 [Epicoccum nigrum]